MHWKLLVTDPNIHPPKKCVSQFSRPAGGARNVLTKTGRPVPSGDQKNEILDPFKQSEHLISLQQQVPSNTTYKSPPPCAILFHIHAHALCSTPAIPTTSEWYPQNGWFCSQHLGTTNRPAPIIINSDPSDDHLHLLFSRRREQIGKYHFRVPPRVKHTKTTSL